MRQRLVLDGNRLGGGDTWIKGHDLAGRVDRGLRRSQRKVTHVLKRAFLRKGAAHRRQRGSPQKPGPDECPPIKS